MSFARPMPPSAAHCLASPVSVTEQRLPTSALCRPCTNSRGPLICSSPLSRPLKRCSQCQGREAQAPQQQPDRRDSARVAQCSKCPPRTAANCLWIIRFEPHEGHGSAKNGRLILPPSMLLLRLCGSSVQAYSKARPSRRAFFQLFRRQRRCAGLRWRCASRFEQADGAACAF